MGGFLSPSHMLFFLVIALLLFGNRLPSVMRSLGQGIVEFKKGLNDVKDDVAKELDDKTSEVKKDA
jgi:sec-independent protein translocase protein TatA